MNLLHAYLSFNSIFSKSPIIRTPSLCRLASALPVSACLLCRSKRICVSMASICPWTISGRSPGKPACTGVFRLSHNAHLKHPGDGVETRLRRQQSAVQPSRRCSRRNAYCLREAPDASPAEENPVIVLTQIFDQPPFFRLGTNSHDYLLPPLISDRILNEIDDTVMKPGRGVMLLINNLFFHHDYGVERRAKKRSV